MKKLIMSLLMLLMLIGVSAHAQDDSTDFWNWRFDAGIIYFYNTTNQKLILTTDYAGGYDSSDRTNKLYNNQVIEPAKVNGQASQYPLQQIINDSPGVAPWATIWTGKPGATVNIKVNIFDPSKLNNVGKQIGVVTWTRNAAIDPIRTDPNLYCKSLTVQATSGYTIEHTDTSMGWKYNSEFTPTQPAQTNFCYIYATGGASDTGRFRMGVTIKYAPKTVTVENNLPISVINSAKTPNVNAVSEIQAQQASEAFAYQTSGVTTSIRTIDSNTTEADCKNGMELAGSGLGTCMMYHVEAAATQQSCIVTLNTKDNTACVNPVAVAKIDPSTKAPNQIACVTTLTEAGSCAVTLAIQAANVPKVFNVSVNNDSALALNYDNASPTKFSQYDPALPDAGSDKSIYSIPANDGKKFSYKFSDEELRKAKHNSKTEPNTITYSVAENPNLKCKFTYWWSFSPNSTSPVCLATGQAEGNNENNQLVCDVNSNAPSFKDNACNYNFKVNVVTPKTSYKVAVKNASTDTQLSMKKLLDKHGDYQTPPANTIAAGSEINFVQKIKASNVSFAGVDQAVQDNGAVKACQDGTVPCVGYALNADNKTGCVLFYSDAADQCHAKVFPIAEGSLYTANCTAEVLTGSQNACQARMTMIATAAAQVAPKKAEIKVINASTDQIVTTTTGMPQHVKQNGAETAAVEMGIYEGFNNKQTIIYSMASTPNSKCQFDYYYDKNANCQNKNPCCVIATQPDAEQADRVLKCSAKTAIVDSIEQPICKIEIKVGV